MERAAAVMTLRTIRGRRVEAAARAITRCGQALELKASFLGLMYIPEGL